MFYAKAVVEMGVCGIVLNMNPAWSVASAVNFSLLNRRQILETKMFLSLFVLEVR